MNKNILYLTDSLTAFAGRRTETANQLKRLLGYANYTHLELVLRGKFLNLIDAYTASADPAKAETLRAYATFYNQHLFEDSQDAFAVAA